MADPETTTEVAAWFQYRRNRMKMTNMKAHFPCRCEINRANGGSSNIYNPYMMNAIPPQTISGQPAYSRHHAYPGFFPIPALDPQVQNNVYLRQLGAVYNPQAFQNYNHWGIGQPLTDPNGPVHAQVLAIAGPPALQTHGDEPPRNAFVERQLTILPFLFV